MRFSLLNLALFAAPILAFTIPEGQANGLYSVYTDADGNDVHTLIQENPEITSEVAQTTNSAKFLFNKRNNVYQCSGDALDQGDTDRANGVIDSQCGNGAIIQPHMNYYSIQGCTVAYACNFAGNAQRCYASARQAASVGITATCGAYKSGWLQSQGGSISYGYEDHCRVQNNFCPN